MEFFKDIIVWTFLIGMFFIFSIAIFSLIFGFGEKPSKKKSGKTYICRRCGTVLYESDKSNCWNGGYNFLCEQATGRCGIMCSNVECSCITWTQTDDEYEKTLPEWCKSHRQVHNSEKWERK